MATITVKELERVRQALSAATNPLYSREQVNAAIQAVEDAMVTTPIPAGAAGNTIAQYLSGVINSATAPVVLTAVQKRILFAHWAALKFERDK